MPDEDRVTLDEFVLTLRIPRDLPDAACAAIRAVTDRPAFLRHVRRAVRRACRSWPALAAVRVRVSR